MLAYVIIILATNVLSVAANAIFTSATPSQIAYIAFCSVFGTIAVIAIDGVTAFIIRRLPAKLFKANGKFFKVSKWEQKLYRKLKINSWKDYVPELGGFSGFHKDKLQSTNDIKYLERFLLESNYGVIIHLVNALCGGLILCLPFCKRLGIGLPVIIVNFVLSLLPIAILRYNTQPLRYLHERCLRRVAKTESP